MLEILDVVIATAAVILGLSLAVQAVQQIIKQMLDLKSSYMRAELLALFGNPAKRPNLYNNIRTVSAISKDAGEVATRIVHEIEDKIRGFGFTDLHLLEDVDTAKMKQIIDELPFAKEGGMKQAYDEAMDAVDRWFDVTKSAFQQHYERRMKYWAFGISLIVVISVNANIIGIYRDFSTNKVLRDAAVAWGEKLTKAPRPSTGISGTDSTAADQSANMDSTAKSMQENITLIKGLVNNNTYQLVRWDKASSEGNEKYFGWLIMALLVSLGAPFWYDMLKTLMGVKEKLKIASEPQTNAQEPKPPAAGNANESAEIPAMG